MSETSQAGAHFAGWLQCPVCRKETRHYMTYTNGYARQRRVWCEECKVVRMQFKQKDGKWK